MNQSENQFNDTNIYYKADEQWYSYYLIGKNNEFIKICQIPNVLATLSSRQDIDNKLNKKLN